MKYSGLKAIILIMIVITILPSIALSQDENIESIIDKLKSNDTNRILDGIEEAGFATPTRQVLSELRALINRVDDIEVRKRAIPVLADYCIVLDINNHVETLWLIIKRGVHHDVAETAYKSLTRMIPKLGGFPDNEVQFINQIISSYSATESNAKSASIGFYATVINSNHSAEEIFNLAQYLSSTDSYILVETAKAYSTLYSRFDTNVSEKKIFTKSELQVGAPKLVEILTHSDYMVRKYAIRALGNTEYDDRETVVQIISILRSDYIDVRIECAKALGKINLSISLETLYQYAIDDRNKDLQVAAVEGLSYMPERVEVEKLSFLKSDVDYKIREMFFRLVVEKIKVTRSRDYIQYLDYAVKKSDWEGSLIQAAIGYGEIPSKDNLKNLEILLNYEDGSYNSFVRIAGAKSLAKHKYKESEELLLDRLEIENATNVIKIIINSLSILGYESSIEKISQFFTSNNYDLMLIAFDAVSTIGGDIAEESILDFVKNNPDKKGYDIAVTILQLRMNLDRKQILKETNPGKYYFEEAQDNFIEAENESNTALKRRYYGRAIENVNKSLNYNSDFAKAYFLRGSCFFNLGQYEEAQSDLEKAIDIGVEDNDIYMALGIINYNLANYDKAEEYFNEYLVKTNQSDTSVYLRTAITQAKSGKYDEAIESVNLYLFSNPEDPEGLKTLADIYHLKGDWLNAIENMEIYLESNPNDIDAIYTLGIEYINYGDLDSGIETMNKVINLVQTDYPRAYFFLGLAYMLKADYDSAKQNLEYFIYIADPIKDAPLIKKARIMLGKIDEVKDSNDSN